MPFTGLYRRHQGPLYRYAPMRCGSSEMERPAQRRIRVPVESLKRDEPAAALFTVPSDYTVKEPLAMARAAAGKAAAACANAEKNG